MFFFAFLSRMTVIHRTKTAHRNANELFCLFSMLNFEMSLFIIILFDQKNLLAQIANQLFVDRFFFKIVKKFKTQIKKIKNDDDESKTSYQSYKMKSVTNLLYFKINLILIDYVFRNLVKREFFNTRTTNTFTKKFIASTNYFEDRFLFHE